MTNNNEQQAWEAMCWKVQVRRTRITDNLDYGLISHGCYPTPTAEKILALDEVLKNSWRTYQFEITNKYGGWSYVIELKGTDEIYQFTSKTRPEALYKLITKLCSELGDEFKEEIIKVVEG